MQVQDLNQRNASQQCKVSLRRYRPRSFYLTAFRPALRLAVTFIERRFLTTSTSTKNRRLPTTSSSTILARHRMDSKASASPSVTVHRCCRSQIHSRKKAWVRISCIGLICFSKCCIAIRKGFAKL